MKTFHFTSTKSWRGYNKVSLCRCVCVCVRESVCLSVKKISAKRMHRFGRGFRKMFAYLIGSDPNEIGELWSTSRSQCRNILITFIFPTVVFSFIISGQNEIWYDLGRFAFKFDLFFSAFSFNLLGYSSSFWPFFYSIFESFLQ